MNFKNKFKKKSSKKVNIEPYLSTYLDIIDMDVFSYDLCALPKKLKQTNITTWLSADPALDQKNHNLKENPNKRKIMLYPPQECNIPTKNPKKCKLDPPQDFCLKDYANTSLNVEKISDCED